MTTLVAVTFKIKPDLPGLLHELAGCTVPRSPRSIRPCMSYRLGETMNISERFYLRIEPELKAMIEKEAERQHMEASQVVRQILWQYFEQKSKGQGERYRQTTSVEPG